MRFKIPVAEPDIGEEELENVVEAVRSGWISGKGKFVEEFEKRFAEYCGVKYGVATNSGTTALHLALVALGIGPGDEVIVPDLTFAATINAVIYTGARPVLVDVHPNYWCIDPGKIKEAITPKTKAIILVHLYGHPCDMDPIIELAERYGLFVVEDAAEAHGAEYKGRKVGSFGHVSCFSFYGNKIITTGEGGMCLTNDEELAEKMKLLRGHGMKEEKRYWHNVVGFSYYMTNLQAAIGVAQLKRIGSFIEKKRRIAKLYAEELSAVDGVTLHPEMPWAKCVYWLYSILVDRARTGVSRDELMSYLEKEGIETRPFFYPLHEMPPYKRFTAGSFPVTVMLSERGLNLPSSIKLTEEEIVYVTRVIAKILKGT